MRLMALDVGKKRIGIALSDPLMIMASGLETYQRAGLETDIKHYQELIDKYEVEKIIVGLPKTLKGELGIAALDILEYAKSLEVLDVEIIMYDERLSSAQAHRFLDEGNVRHKNRRKSIDKIAAAIILSDYMKGLS